VLFVRAKNDPRLLSGALRDAGNEIDKDVPLYRLRPFSDYFSQSIAQPRLNALLVGLFALIALLLAAAGIFGVMSYSVAQRTQEIGIRFALGAQRGDVLRLIVSRGMSLVVIGVALGLVGIFALTRLLQSLIFGIGAHTAIFGIINSVLLRPLPYPDADQIMVLNESSGPGQDFSVALPDYFDWQKETKTFEHLACTHKESRNLSGIPGREAERVSTASVTRNFFNIIGLSPQIGRVFSEDEDKVGAPPAAIISDRIWQRVFNRSPKAIGQSIVLHDQNFTVIGVMPPQMTSPQDTNVWLSLMRRSNNPAWLDRSHHPMMFVWGQLKPGVTVGQARSEMKTIAAQLENWYPETNKGETIVVTPLLENLVGKYRTNLGLLLGAVGLVLLIACA